MSFGDQMKRKADEVHLQEKARDLGDAVTDVVKAAVGMVAGYAAENREKLDAQLDKAGATVDEKTGGKHADTVDKVRASVDRGLDKLVETGDRVTAEGRDMTTGRPVSEVPRTAGSPGDVPDDRHSAFDDDAPAGSPS